MYLPPGEFPPEMVPSMFVQGELAERISLLPGLAPYLDDARITNEILDLSVGPQEVLFFSRLDRWEVSNPRWMILREGFQGNV